ncbi:MAG: GGDEF domain-containing protein [Deltaproteobacteria bacterium HGW-Deltaproteobacteria-10]|nr:MAG: GGDEF domain-containing protein [Deltaproteobacteria bacterium HGW-Deltaproteobacteria-10]
MTYMNDKEQIITTLKKNLEIAQKFFEIEASVLSILNFKDFLERLLTEIQNKRDIPYVWITLIDSNEVADMILKSAPSEILKERTNLITREGFLAITRNSTDPILVNNNMRAFQVLIPPQYKNNIRSLAIAPLTLDGEIIGSINHGDDSDSRYKPEMDTTLLKQLATIVSICLSNVMAHEKLNVLASRDPLTELINRRVLEQILKREFERAVRYDTPLTLVFIDVDDFKIVNDNYGHKAGDHVLKYIAGNLLRMTRGSDVVARFAGDEFIIVLPGTPLNNASELACRMKAFFVDHPLDFEGIPIAVSISFGISCVGKGINDVNALLKKADAMLYKAKEHKGKQHHPA